MLHYTLTVDSAVTLSIAEPEGWDEMTSDEQVEWAKEHVPDFGTYLLKFPPTEWEDNHIAIEDEEDLIYDKSL